MGKVQHSSASSLLICAPTIHVAVATPLSSWRQKSFRENHCVFHENTRWRLRLFLDIHWLSTLWHHGTHVSLLINIHFSGFVSFFFHAKTLDCCFAIAIRLNIGVFDFHSCASSHSSLIPLHRLRLHA